MTVKVSFIERRRRNIHSKNKTVWNVLKELFLLQGEISYLRKELSKRQSEIDAGRKHRENLLNIQAETAKNHEEEKKEAQEKAKSDREFLKRELDLARERIEEIRKNEANDENDKRHSGRNGSVHRRRQVDPPAFPTPPQKRQKMTKSILPSNIDE